METFWVREFFNNTIKEYTIALVIFIVLFFVFKLFQRIILNRLKKLAEKTNTDLDDTVIKIFQGIRPPFYAFLAFWIAVKLLTFYPVVQKIINALLIIWVIYLVIHALQIFIDYLTAKRFREEESKSTVDLIKKIIKGIVWVLGLLLILSNLGVNINSLIAGLGIGGIAVALAVQSILSDLFSSFTIHFDKPFVVGDFIVVGKDMGTVEKIGIKTTRIKSLQGEEIVISNQELTAARIHNYKKMEARRVIFSFGVTYDTPTEKLRKIPEIVKNIIESTPLTKFDRTHFHKFDDSALLFEVVYYVNTKEYNQYMDVNQEIHFQVKESLEKEDISLAFPTQTVHLKK